MFNVLGHHYGTLAELPALQVADVFAGSGAFEASGSLDMRESLGPIPP